MKIITIPVTSIEQNCSLITCPITYESALIDPGGDIAKIKYTVEENQGNIKYILLTHGHADHCAASRKLADFYGVPIWGPHKNDQFWLDLVGLSSEKLSIPSAEVSSSITPDKWLNDKDIIILGHQKLEVRFCPGHTPGHIVFYHESSQVVFVGDVLFAGSVGRTDFPLSSHSQLMHSINTQLLSLNDQVIIYPGHGLTSTIKDEKQHNPFIREYLRNN